MREKLLMNKGWLFYYGEPDYIKAKKDVGDQIYRGSRAENANGPARRDFNDSTWRTVHLPHDFVYEYGQSHADGCIGEKNNFPLDRGSAWYRRYFRLNEEDKDKRITLLFDGVATRCKVYVNSILMEEHNTGGIGFEVDITDVAKFNSDLNVVAVYVDCHDYEAWYYEGGGIYRNVWLIKTNNLAVELWGTYVYSEQLEDGSWDIGIDTTLYNNYHADKTAKVISRILDPSGKEVAETISEPALFPLQESKTIKQTVNFVNPKLWSPDDCNLYELKTFVELDAEIVDEYSTTFGIRKFEFDPGKGLFINGKPVKVIGYANHQIHLGVGNAMSDSMREYQLRTIKEIGGNGFRTAHSPHGDATYDWCDRLGLLVMDENRIFHPSRMTIEDVQRMVKRDRNHPSVLFYSLYNEEDTLTSYIGRRIFSRLASAARKCDSRRPISGATSYGLLDKGSHDEHDLIGVNHQTHNFARLHEEKPGKPLYSSEAVFDLHDLKLFNELDYVFGGYYFTAWSFRSDGEPRYFDALGGKSKGAYINSAIVKKDVPQIKIWPEWDFPGEEGKVQQICVISNCEKVELFLNGESLGAKNVGDLYNMPVYEIPYKPGELKAVGYKDSNAAAEDISRTSGPAASIKLVMENSSLKNNNDDVAIINAYLMDENGNIARNETGLEVTFSCNEAGEFISSASLRPDGVQGIGGPTIRFYKGRVQAFFRSLATEGDLIITAAAKGLPKAELSIVREKTGPIPAVDPEPNPYVTDWQISGVYVHTIDEHKIMKEHMIERWEHIDIRGFSGILNNYLPTRFGPGHHFYPAGTIMNFAYHAYATIPDLKPEKGKKLVLYFEGFDGKGNAYVTNAEKIFHGCRTENSPWPGHYRHELIVDCDQLKPGDKVEIWCFFHDAHRVSGVTWPVRWAYL